jgi:hypothetical protein
MKEERKRRIETLKDGFNESWKKGFKDSDKEVNWPLVWFVGALLLLLFGAAIWEGFTSGLT